MPQPVYYSQYGIQCNITYASGSSSSSDKSNSLLGLAWDWQFARPGSTPVIWVPVPTSVISVAPAGKQ